MPDFNLPVGVSGTLLRASYTYPTCTVLMRLRLLSLLLMATVLLAGTLSCAKKDDPAPPAPTSASYKLGGQLKTCQVTTSLTTSSGHDYMSILLTTTPEPSSGWEQLQLLLGKNTGQPASAYQAVVFRYTKASTTTVEYNAAVFARLALTSTSNGLSGAFTSISPYASSTALDITEGVFTNVPL